MKSRTRRSFLRAMGAGFAALPFSRLLEDSVAQAAGESLPLKFVTIYHPHGVAAEYWAMREGDSETAFDIAYENCSLRCFDDAATYGKSFKDKILIVEGVDHLSNANGHDSAGTILTGSRIDGNKKPQNISLDQFLAVSQGLGAETRVTSVALGVGNDSTESGTTLSYGEGGVPLPKIIDPVAAFDQLFAGFVVGDDPAAQAAAARKRKLGQSVVDFVRGDIERLRPRLAPPEQQKLDQHLTSLRELEKQYQEVAAGASCTVPARPDATGFPSLRQYNGGEPYFDAITDAQVDVLAQALACDITRFATLFLNDLAYEGNLLGLPADNHAAVAHTYNASPVGNNGRPGDGDPATWLPLAKFNAYSYSKLARLMQKLDGLGALDNTLIYMASDMGNPSLHSTRNVPTLLAGGAGGKFKMGRRLRLTADCPTDSPWCGESDAVFTPVTNSRVLVAIAQAYGVAVDSFGTQPEPALTTGALSELVG
ncbi:MAG TPA: DUF1552 domain-containing protein [Polyangiaceae bacterium]|nr:DUF1552 domain-containing protein [Polyangiaceae bacterium]